MKSIVVLSFFLALAAANPVPKRQTGDVANEFVDGGCRDNVLIFSRGTSEPGNMGVIAGPPTANGLKAALGDDAVAAQGVDYAAGVGTNFLAGGADPAGISTMTNLVNKAATECPSSNLLVVGYSQGAAMVHDVVKNLDTSVQNRITGAVLYGDTQFQQTGGQIDGIDAARTKIICNPGDEVCNGTLVILPPHLEYTARAPEAVDFLVGLVKGSGTSSASVAAARAEVKTSGAGRLAPALLLAAKRGWR